MKISEGIENLQLSVRTYNCLKRRGIDTVAQLRKMSADEIRNIRNIGESSYSEIAKALKKYPYSLADEMFLELGYKRDFEEAIPYYENEEGFIIVVDLHSVTKTEPVYGDYYSLTHAEILACAQAVKEMEAANEK